MFWLHLTPSKSRDNPVLSQKIFRFKNRFTEIKLFFHLWSPPCVCTFIRRQSSLDPCMLPTPLCGIFKIASSFFYCLMILNKSCFAIQALGPFFQLPAFQKKWMNDWPSSSLAYLCNFINYLLKLLIFNLINPAHNKSSHNISVCF